MDKQAFKSMLDGIEGNFSPTSGLVVHLRKQSNGHCLSLCTSIFRNIGMVPEECLVWNDEDLVYEGALDNKKLFNVLNKHKVCCAEYTSVDLMEQGQKGMFMCLGDTCSCTNRKCKLRRRSENERKTCINTEGQVATPN